MPYEVQGDVDNVVFPCGTTTGDDGDTLLMYYGAADTSIGVARGSIGEILEWLDANAERDATLHAEPILGVDGEALSTVGSGPLNRTSTTAAPGSGAYRTAGGRAR
jgi:hypothetical protein